MSMRTTTACALHGIWYLIQTRLLRRRLPFIGGFVLTEQCNLGCEHCAVANTGIPDMTWDEVCHGLACLRSKGIRLLAITGGALRDVRNDSWQRPSDICVVYARNREFQCCRSIGNPEACDNCGYMGYPEIISLLKLRPSSIIEALAYLPKGNRPDGHAPQPKV